MNRLLLLLLFLVLVAGFLNCVSPGKAQNRSNAETIDSSRGLKEYYRKYFTVGVAVAPQSLKTDEAGLIRQQFGSLTPENAMKMGPIHPRDNQYFWKDADSIVSFAQRNGLKVRGHCLCWHNQTGIKGKYMPGMW